MSKLTEMARAKTQLSRLATGKKLTTDELVGKDIRIMDAELVSYEETKNNEQRAVMFAVCAVSDNQKKPMGYYQAGKALTDIMVDVLPDADLMTELRADGLHVRLSNAKTKTGRNFVAVEVLD